MNFKAPGVRSTPGRALLGLALLAAWAPELSRAGHPAIGAIRFEGPALARPAALRRIVALELNQPGDPEILQAAAGRLMEQWRLHHHPLARVAWTARPRADGPGVDVVFESEPGPKGRLGEVRFEGNRALSSGVLRRAVSLRPRTGWWDRITGRDVLILEDLALDQQALATCYQEAGHADVVVGAPRVDWMGDERGFRITWPIAHEGPAYRVGAVRVQGGPAGLEDVVAAAGLRRGDPVSPSRLGAARERLRESLLGRGHAFARVDMEVGWNEAEASADIRFRVEEGPVPSLRDIRIRGNTRTREAVVAREIPVRPGDRFDATALVRAQRNLEATLLFAGVDVQYGGRPGEDRFDLDVRVEERPTGRAEAGLTHGEKEGTAILLRLREHNLALGPPWRGSALQGSLEAMAGTEIVRLQSALDNPRLGDSRWGVGGQVFHEDNRFLSDSYDQRSSGFQLRFPRAVGHRQVVSLAYDWNRYDVYGVAPELAAKLPSEETDAHVTAVVASWAYERVDQAFRPSRGVRLQQSVGWGSELLGGDVDLLRYDGRASLYVNPAGEQVFVLRGGVSSVEPLGDAAVLPLPLRIWLGGPGNLRGFAYQSVSPLDDGGWPEGGRSAWWAGAEYLMPLHARLDASLFYEMGDVGSEAWRFAGGGPVSDWGVGFLIRAENFPVRVDVAFPFEVLDGDVQNEPGKAALRFSAGYAF